MTWSRTSGLLRARELVQAGRLQDALALLQTERERSPADPMLLREIESVRDRVGREAIAQLGDLEVVPTRGAGASMGDLMPPERYVAERVDGLRSLASILRFSTLGPMRTAQTLLFLQQRGVVDWSVGRRSAASPAPVAVSVASSAAAPWLGTSTQPVSVLVADANGTQATLTRTLLRLAIPRPVDAITVSSFREAMDALRAQRPSLFVVDFTLPDVDGCEAAQRSLAASPELSAIVVANALDHELARSRLPSRRCALLRRPFDKGALTKMLAALQSGE